MRIHTICIRDLLYSHHKHILADTEISYISTQIVMAHMHCRIFLLLLKSKVFIRDRLVCIKVRSAGVPEYGVPEC